MLPIVTTLNTARFERDVQETGRQAVFALAVAINKTLEQKQAQLRAHVNSKLTVRNSKARQIFGDVFRFGREQRADVKRLPLSGKIEVLGGSVGAQASLFKRAGAIVIRHEEGGSSSSSMMYRNQRGQLSVEGFTIPAPGLRTASSGVPRSLYPAAIGLTTRRAIAGGTEFARQYKGGAKKRGGFKKGTKFYFVKENVGIFVREQVGKQSEYDALWFFRRRINLPRRLRIAETFSNGLEARLAQNYAVAFANAIRTAR